MPETSFTQISTSKIKLIAPEDRLPVEILSSEPLRPNEETISKLGKLANEPRLNHHITALSESFAKAHTPNPTGAIVASSDYILPQMLDTAPNCGMRLILTDLRAHELNEELLRKLFLELQKSIPARALTGTVVSKELMMDVLRYGSAPIAEQFKIRTDRELEHTFNQGTFFPEGAIPERRDIRDAIPNLFLELGRRRLGILGATRSHFVYAVKISDILDTVKAQVLGIAPDQVAFFMHSGSGILGQYTMRLYTPKKSGKIAQAIMKAAQLTFDSQLIKYHHQIQSDLAQAQKSGELVGWKDNSYQARLYLTAHHATSNYGFANRTLLTHALDLTLQSVFSRQIRLKLLYDMPHVFVARESHFGEDLWVYRNGGTRANGPSKMKDYRLFSQTGEPVFIAPFPGTAGYIGTGTDRNASTYYSANHELGKINGIRLDAVSGQSQRILTPPIITATKSFPAQTPDPKLPIYAEAVVREMVQNNIMNLVARFDPIALLTY